MDAPEEPTDTSKAVEQWQSLVDVYEQLGFDISYIEPIEGLPDMVYAANGGFVLDGVAYGAKFQYPERQPEGPAYMDWFRSAGLTVAEPEETNEGEGDFLLIGDTIFAGTGSAPTAPRTRSSRTIYGREVVTLKLINPNFYHLDTAIAVLDPEPAADGTSNIAYLESAFDDASLAILRERFPDAIIATEEDAAILGLNSYSDGYNVVIASRATTFAEQLRGEGLQPDRRRPVRAAARRRRCEVLHARPAPGRHRQLGRAVLMSTATGTATAAALAVETAPSPTTTARCPSSSRRVTGRG